MTASHRHLLGGRGCWRSLSLVLFTLGKPGWRRRFIELAGLVTPRALARREGAALVVAQPLGWWCAVRSNHFGLLDYSLIAHWNVFVCTKEQKEDSSSLSASICLLSVFLSFGECSSLYDKSLNVEYHEQNKSQMNRIGVDRWQWWEQRWKWREYSLECDKIRWKM